MIPTIKDVLDQYDYIEFENGKYYHRSIVINAMAEYAAPNVDGHPLSTPSHPVDKEAIKRLFDKHGFDFRAFEYENEFSAKAILEAVSEYSTELRKENGDLKHAVESFELMAKEFKSSNESKDREIAELKEKMNKLDDWDAVKFYNWLHEEGYNFSDKRYRVYLGGKNYWIWEVYKKYQALKMNKEPDVQGSVATKVDSSTDDDKQKIIALTASLANTEKEIERLKGLIEKAIKDYIKEYYLKKGCANSQQEQENYWQQFKTENNL